MIDRDHGGLDQFSASYKKMGFQVTDQAIRYVEWAPGADEAFLIGDFSGCN